jgi:hypothetical protein
LHRLGGRAVSEGATSRRRLRLLPDGNRTNRLLQLIESKQIEKLHLVSLPDPKKERKKEATPFSVLLDSS